MLQRVKVPMRGPLTCFCWAQLSEPPGPKGGKDVTLGVQIEDVYSGGQIVCVAGNGADSMPLDTSCPQPPDDADSSTRATFWRSARIIFLKGEGEVHTKSGQIHATQFGTMICFNNEQAIRNERPME